MPTTAVTKDKLNKPQQQSLQKFMDTYRGEVSLRNQLATIRRRQEHVEKERDDLIAKRDKGKDLRDTFEKLVLELKKRKDGIFNDIREKENEEAEARTALTQRFQDRISEITSSMETDEKEQTEAVEENKRLRQKLALLGQQVNLRVQQYETREVELKLNDAKTHQYLDIIRVETQKGDLHERQLTEERKIEVVLQGQLNDLTTRFDTLQATISKSNKVFRSYKTEMEGIARKTKNIENEKAQIIDKFQIKKKNHDAVQAEVHDRLKKMEVLKKQHSSMVGLCGVLKQEAEDFAQWKQACPEQFKVVEAEQKEKKKAAAEK